MRTTHQLWNTPVADFDRFFGEVFGEGRAPATASAQTAATFQPRYGVEETEEGFVLSVDLPGVKKEDVEIELKERQLWIKGVRKQPPCESRFERRFELPLQVDGSAIEASQEDGVLTTSIPKSETAKPRQIKVGESKRGLLDRFRKPEGQSVT